MHLSSRFRRPPPRLAPPRLASARSFTFIEIFVAAVLLTITLLGVGAALDAARGAQMVTRERQAAALAANTMLQDLVVVGSSDENGWTSLNAVGGWHQTGFPVSLRPGEVGAVEDYDASGASTTAGTMTPAADGSTLWPMSRSSQSSTVRAQAGYVEVVDVAGRDGLKQITVTVSWRTAIGGEETVMLTQFLFNPGGVL